MGKSVIVSSTHTTVCSSHTYGGSMGKFYARCKSSVVSFYLKTAPKEQLA